MRVFGSRIFYEAIQAIQKADNDPEDTMQIALTKQDIGVISTGNLITCMLFPEVTEETTALAEKMMELASAQDFLKELDDEDDALKRFFKQDEDPED